MVPWNDHQINKKFWKNNYIYVLRKTFSQSRQLKTKEKSHDLWKLEFEKSVKISRVLHKPEKAYLFPRECIIDLLQRRTERVNRRCTRYTCYSNLIIVAVVIWSRRCGKFSKSCNNVVMMRTNTLMGVSNRQNSIFSKNCKCCPYLVIVANR